MLGFDEALARILEQVSTLGTENIDIGDAPNRVLAQPVLPGPINPHLMVPPWMDMPCRARMSAPAQC